MSKSKKQFKTRVARVLRGSGLGAIAVLAACEASSALAAPPAVGDAVSRLVGATLFVGSGSKAARQANEWRATRPADAALMDRMAAQPVARWITDWATDVRAEVARIVSSAAAAGAMPVLVAYNIPNRDLGSYSAGGSASAASYRAWIREFAAGLEGRPAVVVLEPDAVPQTGSMSAEAREERFALLRDAIQVLKAANAVVYLDAGNARWMSAAAIAERLGRAGIEHADGFSLNVSNFLSTSVNVTYGESISRLVGGKHFIIDTSRNGLGGTADGQWCNPPGQGLGAFPTTRTGHSLVDAMLWVKVPGESDGECNGGPHAGVWWPDYALGLAQRQPTALVAR